MEKEKPFNRKDYEKIPDESENIISGGEQAEKRVFSAGDKVKVLRRADMELTNGWEIVGFNNIHGGETAKVHKKLESGEILQKDVSIDDLREWNK